MDPFDWEHRKTRKRDRGTLASSSSLEASAAPPWAAQPVTAQPGTAAAGTVGIFDALPAPEPPPVPIPPPPPAPVAVSELPTSWVAQSSRAPSGRRSFTRVALALGLVVALAAGAGVFFFGRSGTSSGTVLAMSFQQGQILKYRMHVTSDLVFEGAGQSYPLKAEITQLVAMHVVDVGPDGSATVKVTVSHAEGVVNGTRVPRGADGPQQATVEKIQADGQLTSGQPAPGSVSSFDLVPTSDEVVSLLPDHPVEPGDTWTRETTAAFPLISGDALPVSEEITFVRYQMVHGTRAAVLQDHASIPLNLTIDAQKILRALGGPVPESLKGSNIRLVYGGTVTQDVTSWFDPVAGRMLSFSGQARIDATISAASLPPGTSLPPMTISGTISVSLIQHRHDGGKPSAHHPSGDSVA